MQASAHREESAGTVSLSSKLWQAMTAPSLSGEEILLYKNATSLERQRVNPQLSM